MSVLSVRQVSADFSFVCELKVAAIRMELDHMIWRMYLTRAHNIAMPKCCRARKLDLDYVADWQCT